MGWNAPRSVHTQWGLGLTFYWTLKHIQPNLTLMCTVNFTFLCVNILVNVPFYEKITNWKSYFNTFLVEAIFAVIRSLLHKEFKFVGISRQSIIVSEIKTWACAWLTGKTGFLNIRKHFIIFLLKFLYIKNPVQSITTKNV